MKGVSPDYSMVAQGYHNAVGAAHKQTRTADINQYAAAVYMIKVATDNMHSQFARHLTVFEDLA